MIQITPPEIVRIGEAARILGVSIETLRNWDRSDKFKPIRTPAGHRMYRTSELQRLLESQSEEAGEEAQP